MVQSSHLHNNCCKNIASNCLEFNYKNNKVLMDKLVCQLCHCSYRQPKMCPVCSEIYCTKCITDYLNKHHLCPNCGEILPDLVDCTRLIAELRQHVRTPKQQFKNCRTHNLPMKYQCIDCAVPICSDCGVIEDKHRGHRLQQRTAATNQIPRVQLQAYLLSLQECIMHDQNHYQQLVLQRQVLKSELRWCRNRLRQYYEEMSVKLDQEAHQLLEGILADIQVREERMNRLKKVKKDIADILEDREGAARHYGNEGYNQLLQQLQMDSQNTLQKLEKLLQKQAVSAVNFNFNRQSLKTLNQVYPEYVNHTIQFDYQSYHLNEIWYSDTFLMYGQQWRLKVYPHGNGHAADHLSLFLQLLNEPNNAVLSPLQQYYFRLELISLNAAGRTISKEYRSPFTAGDCWGYNSFVSIRDLEEYLNNGQLIFVVGIRNCSYFDVCENMRRYIRKLQGENKVLQQLMGNSNLLPSISASRQSSFIQRLDSDILSPYNLSQQESNIIDSD